jgi:hypothetical protein
MIKKVYIRIWFRWAVVVVVVVENEVVYRRWSVMLRERDKRDGHFFQ